MRKKTLKKKYHSHKFYPTKLNEVSLDGMDLTFRLPGVDKVKFLSFTSITFISDSGTNYSVGWFSILK